MRSDPIVFAVFDQAVRSSFHADLAHYVKSKSNAEFHLYSQSESSSVLQQKRFEETYDSYNIIEFGDTIPAVPDHPEALFSRAAYYENRYGIPLNHFRLVDRHAGLGFSPGGFYHPRSRLSEYASDIAVISRYVNIFDYWEKQIKLKNIDVILNGTNFEYYPAIANNCAVRVAISSKNENYYYWSDNCMGELGSLKSAFEKIIKTEYDLQLTDAPVLNRKQLDKIIDQSKTSDLLKKIGRLILSHSYFYYKNRKNKQYFLKSDLAYVYRSWRNLRRVYNMGLSNLLDVKDKPYVFYALQVEPESNFQGYSPEYFYQLPAIISLARDLPAGTFLAVKEHLPAVGRRPDLFYEQIQLLKNVIFVDPRESGLELVRHAKAIATITGTVGHEAAIMGKPVLSFGRHNLFGFLPHVKIIRQEEEIYPALVWALSDSFDSEKAQRDGQRYLHAFRSLSFDMSDFGFHNPHGYNEKSIEQAALLLFRSIGQELDIKGYNKSTKNST